VFFFFSFQVREKNRKVIITVMILPRTLDVVCFFTFFFETLNFGHFAFYDGAILKYKNKLKKKKSGKEN